MTDEERREAMRKSQHEYYLRNKEKICARNKEYQVANADAIRERGRAYRRTYYEAHREECMAKSRAYHAAHKEQRNEYKRKAFRKFYAEHREEILAKRAQKYRAEHPEKPQTKRKNIITRPRAMTAEERRSHACDVTRKSYRLKRGIPLGAPVNYRTPHYDIPEVTEPDWLGMMNEQWGPDGFRELPADILSDIPEKAHQEYLRRMWLNVDGPATAKYFAYKGAWAPWMEQFGYEKPEEVTEE